MTITLPDAPYSGLVSVAELRAYMAGSAFNTSQNYIAALTLSGIQQELENYLHRPVQPVQMRELLKVDATGCVNPTIAPVHKVIKCESISDRTSIFDLPNNVEYTVTPTVMVRDALVDANGRLLDHLRPNVGDPLIMDNGIFVGELFPGYYQQDLYYAVEYVGGYNGYVDNALKMDILRVAAREMGKNHDETLSLRGDKAERATEPDARQRGWTEEELKGWDRLRRRVIA